MSAFNVLPTKSSITIAPSSVVPSEVEVPSLYISKMPVLVTFAPTPVILAPLIAFASAVTVVPEIVTLVPLITSP